MWERLKELREKRRKLAEDMRAITEAAAQQKRDITTEELAKHGQMFDQVEGLRKQIEAEERQVELNRELAAQAETEARAKGAAGPGSEGGSGAGGQPAGAEERAMTAFRRYLLTGRLEGEGVNELRQMTAGRDPEGGYITAPPVFVKTLLKSLDSLLWMRSAATVIQIGTAESLGVPTLDNDLNDAEWTTELRTGNDDDGLKFGKREFRPHPLAKRLRISKQLLRRNVISVEQLILERLSYKFAVTQEKHFLLGDGNKKPLGIFVPSNDGIPVSRDVSSGNTATQVKGDGLIEAKYSLRAPYWPKAQWLMHLNVLKGIAKLKDNDGQYMWRPSLREGEPDTLLGHPIRVSDFAPNDLSAGKYVAAFGDFSHYWIVDALDMQIQRLVELFALTNQDGFIARQEIDGAPANPDAFIRLQLAA